MEELGNLYTGRVCPPGSARVSQEAAERSVGIWTDAKRFMLVGYGSGDAADAIPIRMVPGWQRAVEAIGLQSALLPLVDLSHDQYLALRDRSAVAGIDYAPRSEFVIDRVGAEATHAFQDAGIEYYRYVQ